MRKKTFFFNETVVMVTVADFDVKGMIAMLCNRIAIEMLKNVNGLNRMTLSWIRKLTAIRMWLAFTRSLTT